jgi:hypothetical protein
MINAYKILVGKREGKASLEKSSRKWEDDVKNTYSLRKLIMRAWVGFIWLMIGSNDKNL